MEYRFLVGTHSGLYEALLTERFDLMRCRKLASGHHYAISVRKEEGRVYSKNQDKYMNILDFSTLEKLGELHFDSEPGHVHQALVTDSGVFYTDTLHNKLSFRSNAGSHHHIIFDEQETDYNHVNSIYFDGTDVFALLHNKGNKNSEIARLTISSEGFALHERVMFNDTGCHNIFRVNGRVVYNASAAGDTIVLDTSTKQEVLRRNFEGHTKGLAVLEDHYVVGVSDHAVRAERQTTSSALTFLGRENMSLVKSIPLKLEDGTKIGNINEIRCLSHPDVSEGLFDNACLSN